MKGARSISAPDLFATRYKAQGGIVPSFVQFFDIFLLGSLSELGHFDDIPRNYSID
jgi:hypothetical protein